MVHRGLICRHSSAVRVMRFIIYFVDEIIKTLGEGTFGKVVKCKDYDK